MQGNVAIHQVLIQWGSDDNAETKWEDYVEMKTHYPDLNLEDKVASKGGGIVMKGTLDNSKMKNDAAHDGVRRSNRMRVANTRLGGYITNM
jgi:hypothetical protein